MKNFFLRFLKMLVIMAVWVPLAIFYTGFSYLTASFLNVANDGGEKILESLRSNTTAIAIILATLAFITNACIGFARVEFRSKSQNAFKYLGILYLMSSIGFITTIITLIGIANGSSDVGLTLALDGWRGRLVIGLCAFPAVITFSVASFTLAKTLSDVAVRRLFTDAQ